MGQLNSFLLDALGRNKKIIVEYTKLSLFREWAVLKELAKFGLGIVSSGSFLFCNYFEAKSGKKAKNQIGAFAILWNSSITK